MGFSLRLQGLDQLPEQLSGVVTALKELEGRVASVHVDRNDEASVRAAIKSIDDEVDRLLLPYQANSAVAEIADEFKAKAAANIRRRAFGPDDRT